MDINVNPAQAQNNDAATNAAPDNAAPPVVDAATAAPASAGSVADLLGGAAPAAPDPQNDANAADGGGDDAANSDWYQQFSGDADGTDASLRDWIKASGVKDPNALAKIARDNQKALRDSNRIKVPSEDASDAEVAEFRKAIGVPETPTDYKLAPVKDSAGNDVPLDDGLIAKLSEAAFAQNVPAPAFQALVDETVKAQLDAQADLEAQTKADAEAWVKAQGAQADVKMAAITRAAEALGLNGQELAILRNGWGAQKALDVMSKLGAGMSEDVLVSGGATRFSTGGPGAAAEIKQLQSDPNFDPVNKPADKVRWDRLNAEQAAYEERMRRQA